MLTIKYIEANGTENLTTDWEMVSSEWVDKNGNPASDGVTIAVPAYRVVHAHNDSQGRTMTFGPDIPSEERPFSPSCTIVYVMNDNGATVATYRI